jgi:hypothetical protein
MSKWLPAFLFFFLATGALFAQDMPPLPPLPNQGQAAAPATAAPPAAPAPSDSNPSTVLPPLPGQPGTTTAPETTTTPPLSGESSPITATAPTTETAPVTETRPAKKTASKANPYLVSKYRPNVIFGGWVKAKGGNETSRMAWTSQEILNALILKKYKLISPDEGKPEEGNYEGQGGRQWREFSFHVPKSKLAVQVYIRQGANKKIWLRVGPNEAVFPEETSLAKSKKMRQADLMVLHVLQKKFGRRLSPNRVVASWEAPYRHSMATADE